MLELVPRAHLQNSVAVMIVGVTECLAFYSRTGIVGIGSIGHNTIRKAHLQVVISVIKRQQIVVQEIKCSNPELKTLPLSDLKGLEQREIAVPEHWPWQVRNSSVTDLPRPR